MGRIAVRLSPHKIKAHGPKIELCNTRKTLSVLKNTLTVDVVDRIHLVTVFNTGTVLFEVFNWRKLHQLNIPRDTASVTVKSCTTNPIPVGFIFRTERKPLLESEAINMSHVTNTM